MQALALSDLHAVGEIEPRIRDVRLAEALGMAAPRNIRTQIERNRVELEGYGPLHTTRAMVELGSRAQREIIEFHLNEGQALLICMISRTSSAAQVRRQLIEVFMAWRRGQPPFSRENDVRHRGGDPIRPDPTGGAFSAMAERLAAVEVAVGFTGRIADHDLAFSLAHMPIWKNGRRPNWWGDLEVRTLLTTAHRQTTIAVARNLLIKRVGPERSPSTSSIHRYWQILDLLHAPSSGRIQ